MPAKKKRIKNIEYGIENEIASSAPRNDHVERGKQKKHKESDHFYKAESKFAVPMVILTLFLLVIIIVQELFVLTPRGEQILYTLDAFIWIAFILELVVMMTLARNRSRYLITHWYDVLIVFIPILRLSRLAKIFTLPIFGEASIVGLRAFIGADGLLLRVVSLIAKGAKDIKDFVMENKFNYIAAVVLLIILLLGSLVATFEAKSNEANIDGIWDGVWWSVETITTVGYGDKYPVTPQGKFVGVILMAFGITAFSLLTASISKFMIGSKSERKDEEILKRLDRIEEMLEEKR